MKGTEYPDLFELLPDNFTSYISKSFLSAALEAIQAVDSEKVAMGAASMVFEDPGLIITPSNLVGRDPLKIIILFNSMPGIECTVGGIFYTRLP